MSHLHKLRPITLGDVRTIRNEVGIDLLKSYEPETQGRLSSDAVAVGRIVAICGGPQDLSGELLGLWSGLLMESLVNFFPKKSVFDDFDEGKKGVGGFDPWRVVFRASGLIGMPPWEFSFRELIWAAQGAYEPHAERMAFEASKSTRGKTVNPETVNPWHPRRPRPRRSRRNATKLNTD